MLFFRESASIVLFLFSDDKSSNAEKILDELVHLTNLEKNSVKSNQLLVGENNDSRFFLVQSNRSFRFLVIVCVSKSLKFRGVYHIQL